jgi:hypothetical protein
MKVKKQEPEQQSPGIFRPKIRTFKNGPTILQAACVQRFVAAVNHELSVQQAYDRASMALEMFRDAGHPDPFAAAVQWADGQLELSAVKSQTVATTVVKDEIVKPLSLASLAETNNVEDDEVEADVLPLDHAAPGPVAGADQDDAEEPEEVGSEEDDPGDSDSEEEEASDDDSRSN